MSGSGRDAASETPFGAYRGTEPFVFVSYAHRDSPLAFPELLRLNKLGYRIWYDEGIDPGNEWPEAIAVTLKKCSYFLVFLSPAAVVSKNVRDEIYFAIEHKKPITVIYLKETELPAGLALRISSLQAVMKWRMSAERYRRALEQALPETLKGPPQIEQLPIVLSLWERIWNGLRRLLSGESGTGPVSATTRRWVLVAFLAITVGGVSSRWLQSSGLAIGRHSAPIPAADYARLELWRELPASQSEIDRIALSSDSVFLTAQQQYGGLLGWDLRGDTKVNPFGLPDATAAALLVSPGGLVAGAKSDEQLILWDLVHQRELRRLKLAAKDAEASALSANGDLLASIDSEGRLTVVRTADNHILHQSGTGEAGSRAASFSPDGTMLATAKEDVVLWDTRTWTARNRLKGHSETISALAFSPDSSLLASGGVDREVVLWNPRGATFVTRFGPLRNWVNDLAYSPDGNVLAVATGEGALLPGDLTIWDVKSFRQLVCLRRESESVTAVAFSSGGRTLLAGGATYTWSGSSASTASWVRLWRLPTL